MSKKLNSIKLKTSTNPNDGTSLQSGLFQQIEVKQNDGCGFSQVQRVHLVTLTKVTLNSTV